MKKTGNPTNLVRGYKMARFKIVIVKLTEEQATILLKRGVAYFVILDQKSDRYQLIPAEGLHHRKGL